MADDQLAVDLWQLSHTVTPLWIGVPGLPTAGEKEPLWQVAHCVDTDTELWKLAGVQLVKPALWQLSQLALAEALTD